VSLGFLWKSLLFGFEPTDIGDQNFDLIVGKSAAESGHAARFAKLNAVENLLVGLIGTHQLRSLACPAATIFVTKATDVPEHGTRIEGRRSTGGVRRPRPGGGRFRVGGWGRASGRRCLTALLRRIGADCLQ